MSDSGMTTTLEKNRVRQACLDDLWERAYLAALTGAATSLEDPKEAAQYAERIADAAIELAVGRR